MPENNKIPVHIPFVPADKLEYVHQSLSKIHDQSEASLKALNLAVELYPRLDQGVVASEAFTCIYDAWVKEHSPTAILNRQRKQAHRGGFISRMFRMFA